MPPYSMLTVITAAGTFLYASIDHDPSQARAGMDHILSCSVGMLEGPQGVANYQWTGPGDNPVLTTDHVTVSTSSNSSRSSLHFLPAQQSQEGVYTCHVMMNGYNATDSAKLEVIGKTWFTYTILQALTM